LFDISLFSYKLFPNFDFWKKISIINADFFSSILYTLSPPLSAHSLCFFNPTFPALPHCPSAYRISPWHLCGVCVLGLLCFGCVWILLLSPAPSSPFSIFGLSGYGNSAGWMDWWIDGLMEGVARLRGLRFRYPLGGFLDRFR